MGEKRQIDERFQKIVDDFYTRFGRIFNDVAFINNTKNDIKEGYMNMDDIKKCFSCFISICPNKVKEIMREMFFKEELIEKIFLSDNYYRIVDGTIVAQFNLDTLLWKETLIKTVREIPTFQWFKKLPQYHEIVLKLMYFQSPIAVEFFNSYSTDRLKMQYNGFSMDESSFENSKAINPVLFMSKIEETVNEYKGRNSNGKEYSISQSVLLKFREARGEDARKTQIQAGFTSGKKELGYIALCYRIDKWEKEHGIGYSEKLTEDELIKRYMSIEENIGEDEREKRYQEIKFAREFVRVIQGISLSQPIGEDDDGTVEGTIAGNSPEGYNEYEKKIDSIIYDSILESYDLVDAYPAKKQKDVLNALLAREILRDLKLLYLETSERKKYKNSLEAGCRVWCTKADSCELKDENKGCYIRYHYKYPDMPAGNESIYKHIELQKERYLSVLKNVYIKKAFSEEPENWYDIYNWKLSDEFKFTDTYMKYALGHKSNNNTVKNARTNEKNRKILKALSALLLHYSEEKCS